MSKRGRKTGRNRSVTQFEGPLKRMVEAAANDMESITLFQNPLPDPQQSEDILNKVLRDVEVQFATDIEGDKIVWAYVC